MKDYELMVIFRATEEAKTSGLDKVKKTLADFGGTVNKEEDREEKTLAYPVKKQERGHYYLFDITLDPSKIVEIDKVYKLQDELLKFMFIKKD